MNVENKNELIVENVHHYSFQGQEEDNELWAGGVSFKYRVEDARLGRFFSVDPLFVSYPWNSSYAFSENSLIAFVELEGLEKVYYDANQGNDQAEAVQNSIVKSSFEETSAYKEITSELTKSGKYDVYILVTGKEKNVQFDERGFKTSGRGGTTTVYSKTDHDNNINKNATYGQYENFVEESFKEGREVIIITITSEFLNQMVAEKGSNDANWKIDEYVNTLENAVHTLMHEVNAHARQIIAGINLPQEIDHSKYNFDGLKSATSPPYRSIPLHGKSPDSKDKLENRQMHEPMRAALVVLRDAAKQAMSKNQKLCGCGN